MYRALAGPDRKDAGEAALTCLAFRGGAERAAEATTYLRMPGLREDEREAVRRVEAVLRDEGVPSGPYRALVDALAPGALESFTGLQELVSHRTGRRRGDVTTYLRFPVYPDPGRTRPDRPGHQPVPLRAQA
ncbi:MULTISPECIES: hypothetical protein [Streptomyces]|uniref:hypothetical protein n=1 Tax=Streptomyces TaxID=1883 RepID=UPI00163BFDD3|nr:MULTISPECIES: hypothetical protein [Streptomyces]MBC2875591.1 hypothetical protein [Streptomyces sp. TYQ1024]UBI35824.1 hypothetical protein K7I03_04670 [Streptomyces mobaraensis]UKW28418.1 hypothetical protein MCU78_04670 [Streptomyces sp. TYQ1024]